MKKVPEMFCMCQVQLKRLDIKWKEISIISVDRYFKVQMTKIFIVQSESP